MGSGVKSSSNSMGRTLSAECQASAIIARDGLRGIGGSDAHYVNWFLKCATVFERQMETMPALVEELYAVDSHRCSCRGRR